MIKKILIFLGGFVVATSILLVSLSRATLEVMMRDDKENKLRTEPVIIGGEIIYKLPQTNMLPDNFFYGFKELRDWLWQKYSFGYERQIKIILILADKKISEAISLTKIGKYDLAIKTGMEAVDKLKYGDKLIAELKKEAIFQREMLLQIKDMALVYEKIIEEMGVKVGNTNSEYIILSKNIHEIKEKL